jgi:hypothetical protein
LRGSQRRVVEARYGPVYVVTALPEWRFPDLHDEALFVRPGLVPDIHPLGGAFSGLPGQARS